MGRYLIIDHGYSYQTMYGHLSETTVRRGAKVRRREKIAEMGNTGRSTGPHLHYEVRYKGRVVNPWHYIFVED